MKLRHSLILILIIIVSLTTLSLGLMLGSKTLALEMLWKYFHYQAPYHETLIFNHRLPRTIIAFICGAALGVSGALMQGITRNPLGDPGLLGINAGSAAMIVLSAFLPTFPLSTIWLAFFGAFIIAAFITFIGLLDRSNNQTRLILMGAAISTALFAFIKVVTLWYPQTYDQYRFWSSGSFSGVSLHALKPLLPLIIFGLFGAMFMGNSLNIFALGREKAKSLGLNTYIQTIILLLVAILTSSTVALAGPISFIGLGATHIARYFIGTDYRLLLPASLFSGAILLLLADILARTLLAPSEVATGIITALLGAPILYLLMVNR